MRRSRFTEEQITGMRKEQAAGIKKSLHGLRKAGATGAAEQRTTLSILEAIFGWVGGRKASH